MQTRPTKSSCQLAVQIGVSKSSPHRVMTLLKLHSYKITAIEHSPPDGEALSGITIIENGL
jgi:hypothetical protein